MSKSVTIALEKRNISLTGEITDADGMFYLSLVFSKEERALMEEGRPEEASEHYNNRMKKRLSKAKTEAQREALTKEIDKEIFLALFQLIERDKKVRSQFIWRTLEIFPDFPSHLIYYKDEIKNGLRLDADEIMEITMSIIKEALTDVQEKLDKKEPLPPYVPTQEAIDVSVVGDREARLAQLEAEMAALKAA